MSTTRTLTLIVLAVVNMSFVQCSALSVSLQWTRQISTRLNDFATDVTVDGLGNVYITGEFADRVPSSVPPIEAFATRYDSSGTLQWTRRLDSNDTEFGVAISADGLGNIFMAGDTFGSLFAPNADGRDIFLANYSAAGVRRWGIQFDASWNGVGGLATDGLGNAYLVGSQFVSGQSGDAFVHKYDSLGDLTWSRLLGSEMADSAAGVDVDRLGSVFLTGETRGNVHGINQGQTDVYVSKLDANGNVIWSRQIGTPTTDTARAVAGDGLGNVYVAGSTYGVLSEGQDLPSGDGFLAKFNRHGSLLWTRQFGSEWDDIISDLHADEFGNIYVTGSRFFTEPPSESAGFHIWKFDHLGNLDGTQQIAGFNDFGGALAVAGGGHFYVTGSGSGSLSQDPELWKLFDSHYKTQRLTVPEPSSIAIYLRGMMVACGYRCKGRGEL